MTNEAGGRIREGEMINTGGCPPSLQRLTRWKRHDVAFAKIRQWERVETAARRFGHGVARENWPVFGGAAFAGLISTKR
jgi:hypothetical protein